MKIIILILFFTPVFVQGQTIHKRSVDYWDNSLKKTVCCDSIFNVNSWLDAGDNDKGDTRYPYLQFSILKSKRDGFSIEFDGQCSGSQYESTSNVDTIEFEFENHDIIKFAAVSGSFQRLGANSKYTYINASYLTDKIQLNEKDLILLMTNPIYKISFKSSERTGLKGEFIVRPKYKNEIINCIKILLK